MILAYDPCQDITYLLVMTAESCQVCALMYKYGLSKLHMRMHILAVPLRSTLPGYYISAVFILNT